MREDGRHAGEGRSSEHADPGSVHSPGPDEDEPPREDEVDQRGDARVHEFPGVVGVLEVLKALAVPGPVRVAQAVPVEQRPDGEAHARQRRVLRVKDVASARQPLEACRDMRALVDRRADAHRSGDDEHGCDREHSGCSPHGHGLLRRQPLERHPDEDGTNRVDSRSRRQSSCPILIEALRLASSACRG